MLGIAVASLGLMLAGFTMSAGLHRRNSLLLGL